MSRSTPQELELCNPRGGGRLSREADQECVEPPSLPDAGQERGPIGAGHSEPGRQSPKETVGSRLVPRTSSTNRGGRHRPGSAMASGILHCWRWQAAAAPGSTRPVPGSSQFLQALPRNPFLSGKRRFLATISAGPQAYSLTSIWIELVQPSPVLLSLSNNRANSPKKTG